MNPQLSLLFVVILAAVVIVSSSSPNESRRLSFKVSARGLKERDLLKTDPYVKITSLEGDSATETRVGKSSTISGNNSPDWPEIFTFDYDRSKKQKLHFEVKSREVIFKESEGDAYLNVNDYVDKNEYMEINLSKQGYLIIQKA